tara:strand:- start:2948 stop:3148 length:201 start_codon:yes stop_codon:yes gene_type:complete
MVSAVDDGVGRVLKTLEENGIDQNTLIVFLSDNQFSEGANTIFLTTAGANALFDKFRVTDNLRLII